MSESLRYITGNDLQLSGPIQMASVLSKQVRLVHVVTGVGYMTFPDLGHKVTMKAGDLFVLAPGLRELEFSSQRIRYRHHTVVGFGYSEPAERLTLRGSRRELFIAGLMDLLGCEERRQQVLLVLNSLIEEDRRSRRRGDGRVQSLMHEICEDPLCFGGVEDMAEKVGVTPVHLRRLFRQTAGMTPKAFLQRQRMRYARSLLQETSLAVRDVAERIGYSDAFVFSRQYRSLYGVPPSRDRSEV